MVQVSAAAIDGNPFKPATTSSKSPFSLLNCILGAIALIFVIVASIFIALFVISNNTTQQVEKELERLKGRNRGDEGNDVMTCSWMGECRNKRPGPPPLLVISMDGFANKYANWQSTPTIKKMGECGGHAEFMYPSFPSKTFPNHYTIATGLYPGSHGVIDNSFYTPDGTKYDSQNGSFYGGEPIWNTVVKNGKVSKTYMWLGSYDKINGVEASYHTASYDGSIAFINKIENVTEWLSSDDPPALSMLYLEEPDWTGHSEGPDSDKVREAAIRMDGLIQYILRKLHEAGVLGCTNIILSSDHGMTNIKKQVNLHSINPEYSQVRTSTGNNVIFYGNISTDSLQCKNGSDYRVYRSKEEFPIRYHYDHENIGFPYILGNPGTMFVRNDAEFATSKTKNQRGNHGWDNMDTQMQAIFYAVGPSIKYNIKLAPFQNINLYNLFADLIEIPAAPNNGTTGLLDDLLVDPPKRENPFENFHVSRCEKVSFEDCATTKKSISTSNTTGYLQSEDTSICSISTGKLFLLYSSEFERTVGMEIQVKKTGSFNEEFITKSNKQVIGKNCGEEGGKSALNGLVPESSLKLTLYNFNSSSLVEKAISKLSKTKNIRIQIGFVYGTEGSITSTFVTGFWCEGDWRKEKDYCINEADTRTESYVIPASAVENFNCLDEETLLFDYRTTFGDIERITNLSLLPKSMPLPTRRRISSFIPSQVFV